jgi:hypothetical protein
MAVVLTVMTIGSDFSQAFEELHFKTREFSFRQVPSQASLHRSLAPERARSSTNIHNRTSPQRLATVTSLRPAEIRL